MARKNRKTDELRKIEIIPDFQGIPSGVTLVSFGSTKVLTSVSTDNFVPPYLRGTGTGWLNAEYSIMPYATIPRNRREREKISGRTQEIQRLIGRSLRCVTDLGAFGEKTVKVDCDVLQADGGTRTAAITGAFTALYIFFKRQQKARKIFTFPVTGHIAAVSCGIVEGEALLDLDYEEDYMATCDMNVVGDGDNFAEVQSSGEEKLFTRAQLDKLTGMASAAIKDIIAMQKEAIKSAM
ncbi:MAG: ribonuclease PH [Elusimicrobia bacterium CG_4_10_14_3_um_filter_49_12_50_7]|nr:MAG: ribonuclease PH [Elusimicrobia bacterium CG03_land_8_20_14_0_80_50_18]PIY15651.1 MAG: ribonuclease PH [Elusimicrobia bacterium CG_4_10_14_3_um_filter_49_12_50_7]